MSRPPWARELKRVRVREAGDGEQSRPPWARELKLFSFLFVRAPVFVAPPVGA